MQRLCIVIGYRGDNWCSFSEIEETAQEGLGYRMFTKTEGGKLPSLNELIRIKTSSAQEPLIIPNNPDGLKILQATFFQI